MDSSDQNVCKQKNRTVEIDGNQTLTVCWCNSKSCLLGRGSFGGVHIAHWTKDGKTTDVAVKDVRPHEIQYEIHILQSVSHPNILQYHFEIDDGPLRLVNYF